MIVPTRLAKGQIIGVFSPSGSVTYSAEDTALYEKGLSAIQAIGYSTVEAEFTRHRYYHMSATAEQKAKDIHSLFEDPDVAALLPSVGGHTASQILPYLDFDLIRANPKVFIGFSDSAVLGMCIAEKCGMLTYHSAVDVMFGFSRFGKDDCPMQNKGLYTLDCLWRMVEECAGFGKPYSAWVGLRDGVCTGRLIGGNIKGIQALIGTPFEPDWRDKILYWEAADPPHVMAQVLTHLRNAGVLTNIAGMVVGKVGHLKETCYGTDEIMPIHEFIAYITEGINIPIIVEADFGHDVENITLPNGAVGNIRVANGEATLAFEGV